MKFKNSLLGLLLSYVLACSPSKSINNSNFNGGNTEHPTPSASPSPDIEEIFEQPIFYDVTQELGIPKLFEINSASWGDFNNDKYPDVVIVGKTTELYLNNSGQNFTPVNLSENTNGLMGWGRTSYITDMDKDSDLDIIIGGSFDRPTIQVLWNQLAESGNLGFISQNIWEETNDSENEMYNSTFTGFGTLDLNNDDKLDLFVSRRPQKREGDDNVTGQSALILLQKENKNFENIINLSEYENLKRCTSGVVYSFQFITRETLARNILYIEKDMGAGCIFEYSNKGDFSLTDYSFLPDNEHLATMGNDYFIDEFETRILSSNTGVPMLHTIPHYGIDVNNTSRLIEEEDKSVSWSIVLDDYNNDGKPDFSTSGGRLDACDRSGSADNTLPKQERLSLFLGSYGGRFVERSKHSGKFFDGTITSDTYSMVDVDYNLDGKPDLSVAPWSVWDCEAGVAINDTPFRVFRNDGSYSGNWIGFYVPSSFNNSLIKIKTPDKNFYKPIKVQGSTGSNLDGQIHVGLGKINTIDNLEIFWSDNTTSTIQSSDLVLNSYNRINK